MTTILPEEPSVHRAARLGDLTALEQLISNGADINQTTDITLGEYPEPEQLTPLMVAACSNDGANVETLAWLLNHGADLYALSSEGVTAAWYAAGGGAIPNTDSSSSMQGDVERLRFLLGAGLDPAEMTSNGHSLMVNACSVGDPERVRLLLERGASPFPVVSETVAHIYAPSTQEEGESVSRLSSSLRIPFYSWQIPLFCAAASGSAESVQLLLAAGANPNTLNSDGIPPLAHVGSSEAAILLIAAGAHLLITPPYGGEKANILDVVLDGEYLVERSELDFDAEEEIPDNDVEKYDPRHLVVAEALLGAGIPLETLMPNGWTRLYNAAFQHKAEVVDFLLARGAFSLPNTGDRTALHAVCWCGDYDGCRGDTSAACERIVHSLARAGFPLEAINDEGSTPLHEAVGGDWGNPSAVRTLLQLGANPDSRDSKLLTPLYIAALNGEIDCIRLLLAAGADPNIRDCGYTALQAAQCYYNYSANKEELSDYDKRKLEEAKQGLALLTAVTTP